MPTKPKSIDVRTGTISEDLEVPIASEVIFREVWEIKKFHKTIVQRDLIDSPSFKCSVNGVSTFWNMSLRFWKGPNGKRVKNPVVVCLNLTGCQTDEMGQARVRFQFGVWDAAIKHWECCPISSVILNLQNSLDLLSVGYKSLEIHKRHLNQNKDVSLILKLQIIQNDEQIHSLSQDMSHLMVQDDDKDTLIECCKNDNNDDNNSDSETSLKAHSWLIKARSQKLWSKLYPVSHEDLMGNIKFKLNLTDFSLNLIKELLRYIYTDKVDNSETHAAKLLALSVRYQLPGLTSLCERTLLESLTPNNVASILMLSDQCGCENLRKAALHYCEQTDEIKMNFSAKEKSLAWRVMEMVNPDLFLEACETFGSSSSNLDSTGTPGSWSD